MFSTLQVSQNHKLIEDRASFWKSLLKQHQLEKAAQDCIIGFGISPRINSTASLNYLFHLSSSHWVPLRRAWLHHFLLLLVRYLWVVIRCRSCFVLVVFMPRVQVGYFTFPCDVGVVSLNALYTKRQYGREWTACLSNSSKAAQLACWEGWLHCMCQGGEWMILQSSNQHR